MSTTPAVPDPGMDAIEALGELHVLRLEIDGRRLVFAAPVPHGVDPMEMTLGEWTRYSALSAAALFNDFMERHARVQESETGGEDG